MIGGAPYLMRPLEECLEKANIQPLYAFTKRISIDKVQADGTIKKESVFKHSGWVTVK